MIFFVPNQFQLVVVHKSEIGLLHPELLLRRQHHTTDMPTAVASQMVGQEFKVRCFVDRR